MSKGFRLTAVTRRMIANNSRQFFDSLGQVTPITMSPRFLFQKTWVGDKGSDDDIEARSKNNFRAEYTSLVFPPHKMYHGIWPCLFQQVDQHLILRCNGESLWSSYWYQDINWSRTHTILQAANWLLASKKTVCILSLELCSAVPEPLTPEVCLEVNQAFAIGGGYWRLEQFKSSTSLKITYSLVLLTALLKGNIWYQPTSANISRLIKAQPIIQLDR